MYGNGGVAIAMVGKHPANVVVVTWFTETHQPHIPRHLTRSLRSQASSQQHVSPHILPPDQNYPKFSGSHFFFSLEPLQPSPTTTCLMPACRDVLIPTWMRQLQGENVLNMLQKKFSLSQVPHQLWGLPDGHGHHGNTDHGGSYWCFWNCPLLPESVHCQRQLEVHC